MRLPLRLACLLALALPLVVAPDAASVAGPPTPHCVPGPDNCLGWYTTNVTISWTYDVAGVTSTAGCNVDTVTSDTAGKAELCQVSYGGDSYSRTVTIRRDATPPQVTGAAPERAPDAGEWFNHAVAVVVTGTDATSGIASCDRPTYGGGDSASVQVSGTCRDVAGNAGSTATATIRYDATPPSVTAAPGRKPDRRGWYRRPVTVSFRGADATSGVASCTGPSRYAGPDAKAAAVAGTCRDGAGNTGQTSFAVNYDATPPKLTVASAEVARGVARVRWKRPRDTFVVELARTPGVNGARRTVVYRGTGERFVDRTVRSGVRYRYAIRVVDAAGNVAQRSVTAKPASPLYRPPAGAVVRAPLVLAWEPFPKARYYNVQLYRGRTKVLTAWPSGPRFRVPARWRYAGRRQALVAGVYRWYVWPALGTRERPRFGGSLGSSTFRVR